MNRDVESQFQISEHLQAIGLVPSVIEYRSYRDYLRDVLAAEKRENPGATLARVGRIFGLSASALQMVVAGSRNLSIHLVYRIARTLKMSPEEIECFEGLVLVEQARDSEEREYHERKLNRLRELVRPTRVRIPGAVLMSRWFVPALLVVLTEVLREPPDENKVEELARVFGVDCQEMLSLLAKLRSTGVLSLSGGGRFHFQPDKLLNTFSQKRFLVSLLQECQRRVEVEFSNPHAFFSADTFAIPLECVRSFVLDYKDLVQKYMSISDDSDKESAVMQAAIQLFPVWK